MQAASGGRTATGASMRARYPGGGPWMRCARRQVAALGWAGAGDISDLPYTKAGKATLRERVDAKVDLRGAAAFDVTQDIFNLALRVAEGDLVIVTEGDNGRAIGRVTGAYEFAADSALGPPRPVEWLDLGETHFPAEKGWARALTWYDQPGNRIAVEERLLHPEVGLETPTLARLRGREGHVQSILDRKGQVILYGPPGTGKTYWAQRAAEALLAQHLYAKGSSALADDERGNVQGHIRLCTFHPAYGYEDFLEGYRPEESDGRLVFHLRDGVFKQLCEAAAARPRIVSSSSSTRSTAATCRASSGAPHGAREGQARAGGPPATLAASRSRCRPTSP